jgi:hypothetical protein
MRSYYLTIGCALSIGCSGGGVFIPRGDGGTSSHDASELGDGGVKLKNYNYVFNHLTLPTQRTDYAIDLNGDGTPDNQFGAIISALAAQNTQPQPAEDMLISMGTTVYLLVMGSADPTLMNQTPLEMNVWNGVPTTPDFSGNGTFTIQGQTAAILYGALASGQVSSEDPVTTKSPQTLSMALALFGGASAVPLPVHGVHVKFHTGTDPSSGAPGLLEGELHGSVKKSELDTVVFPAVAARFTQQIQADPSSASSMQIEEIFDTGGCTNPDGSQAFAGDHVISPCEVSMNQIIANLFAPDVQIYNSNGDYAPNPANTNKDSLSLGIAFTAVRAAKVNLP